MAEKTYKKKQLVEYAFCDHRGEARLSYLLAMAQQISMEHCDSAGVGGSFFYDRGAVFLLAKLRLDIPRTPKGGELLELHTRPNLPVRAQYRRCTSFSTQDGELLCDMDSRWVLVDIESRRVLRRLPEGVELPFLDAEEISDFRPFFPKEFTLREKLTVRYSMLDVNNHMNNTVYGDIVANLLEHRLLGEERLRSVEIFYHREALPGDVLTLWSCEEENRFFIRATVGETVCFEASGTLEKVL
ncbi:MAG: thioesterase [Angelakisella sp.]